MEKVLRLSTLFQQALFDSKKVNQKYWEAYLDHLAYFSRESLISLCENNNWKTEKVTGEFFDRMVFDEQSF